MASALSYNMWLNRGVRLGQAVGGSRTFRSGLNYGRKSLNFATRDGKYAHGRPLVWIGGTGVGTAVGGAAWARHRARQNFQNPNYAGPYGY